MKFEKYNHHGCDVWVKTSLKGLHREHCLCFSCKKLNTQDRSKNCQRANELFEFDKKYNMTTPVFECPVFEK